jgi:hypothetical protein
MMLCFQRAMPALLLDSRRKDGAPFNLKWCKGDSTKALKTHVGADKYVWIA